MILATAQEVLDFYKVDADSSLVDSLVSRVTKMFENYCGRVFSSAASVEYFDGGYSRYFVERYPISSSPAVQVWEDPDREFGSGDEVDAEDISVDYDNGIVIIDFTLAAGNRNVKISYTGGYTTAPVDLKQACVEQVVKMLREGVKGNIGIPSRTYPDGSISFDTSPLLPSVKFVLDLYRSR